jgi:uncharacterized membrane protein
MTLLILGLVVFLGVHSISIAAPAWRDSAAARLGPHVWQGIYSLLAAAGLAMIVVGYGQARGQTAIVYVSPLWMRDIAVVGMAAVFPLLLAAYLPGRIKAAVKHPMLIAVKLWALLHLLANGSLADVALFGSLLTWAVVDRISLKRRRLRPVPSLPRSRWNDVLAVSAGLGLYALFMFGAHRWLIGVPAILATP